MDTPRRIHIIGPSGSGKTTLGKRLSERLGIPLYELDDLYWIRKFDIARTKEERMRLLDPICRRKEWITEGAGTSWTHAAISRADLIIELHTPRPTLIFRVLKRAVRRQRSKNPPKETLANLWGLCKYIWQYRKPTLIHHQQYQERMRYAKGTRVVVKTEKDLQHFLERLEKGKKTRTA